jgi:hypothetical protein
MMEIVLKDREVADAILECLVRRGVLAVGVYHEVKVITTKGSDGQHDLRVIVRPQPEESH